MKVDCARIVSATLALITDVERAIGLENLKMRCTKNVTDEA